MNNLVEQREIERAQPPKTGLVSMMTVFRKKNKSKKFNVKDTLDLNIKAWHMLSESNSAFSHR
jgi:hypothetical protein